MSSMSEAPISILIVDDDEGSCRTLSMILKRLRYDVQAAHEGREALARVKERPFDLILLDIRLPDTTGTDLLEPLRRELPDVVVVLVTAYASTETAIRALNEGASAYITKPYSIDQVLAVLRQSLEKQRLVRENRELVVRVEKAHRELQEATAQLVHREKLVALGELAAGVAHELNQPLNSMKLICQTTLRYFDSLDSDAMKEDLAEMLTMIRQMSQIIDDMRVFSRRVDVVERKPVDVSAVARRALRFIEQQLVDHGIEVAAELAEPLAPIEGDALRIQQVLLNLVSNARFAVEKSERPDKRIAVRTYEQHPAAEPATVVIEVEDNGVGIPEELLSRVFMPFVTTRRPGEGTGLGLSIAHRIIEEHDGDIAVESRVGVGTKFRLVLPVAAARKQPQPRGTT